ncbi:MAG: MgtC/SapB family protein, partial [Pisciglobus halotolerans]|nr:MgtC/SapB family protein [Pisciglobus halotolerans]
MNGIFIWRLLLASLLGGMIGIDREIRSKEAGIRTHFLVALGAALVMIISQHGFNDVINTPGYDLDPARVAAQVVSGIGFIGAGMIIIQQKTVKGLTSAAGIWTTAAIGLTVGGGLYTLSIVAAGLTLLAFELSLLISKRFGSKMVRLTVATTEENQLQVIFKLLQEKNRYLMKYELEQEKKDKV